MRRKHVRAGRHARWMVLGAAVLLATIALSLLHAGGSHYRAQCGCSAMLTLEAPAAAHACGDASFAVSSSEAPLPDPEYLPRSADARRLRHLRAPPHQPVV